jgi:hypothetical protein
MSVCNYDGDMILCGKQCVCLNSDYKMGICAASILSVNTGADMIIAAGGAGVVLCSCLMAVGINASNGYQVAGRVPGCSLSFVDCAGGTHCVCMGIIVS